MKHSVHNAVVVFFGAALLVGCRRDPALIEARIDALFVLDLPPGAPLVSVPADAPMTQAAVELGKALFFDPRLSRNGTISCASCHFPDHAFSDTMAFSRGIEGQLGMRNAPTLANVAYHPYFFRDGGVPDLERQVIAPILDPVEMDHDLMLAAAAVNTDPAYRALSQLVYGRAIDPFVLTRAIATYERTLISGWSRYDRFVYRGELGALTAQEQNGMALFNSEELNCTGCHNGFDLSDHSLQNIGQYLEYADPGRERITVDPADNGKFKVPTLRNIALTAPYMHDGAMTSLSQVIDHFASGGLAHPNKSAEMSSFAITAEEKANLIAFLNSLTDERSIDQVP